MQDPHVLTIGTAARRPTSGREWPIALRGLLVLETKARDLAQAHLNAAIAEADRRRAVAERDAERIRAEIEAQRAGLRPYLSYWIGQAARVTVEIYEQSVGAVVAAVSRALSGKGERTD